MRLLAALLIANLALLQLMAVQFAAVLFDAGSGVAAGEARGLALTLLALRGFALCRDGLLLALGLFSGPGGPLFLGPALLCLLLAGALPLGLFAGLGGTLFGGASLLRLLFAGALALGLPTLCPFALLRLLLALRVLSGLGLLLRGLPALLAFGPGIVAFFFLLLLLGARVVLGEGRSGGADSQHGGQCDRPQGLCVGGEFHGGTSVSTYQRGSWPDAYLTVRAMNGF